MDSVCYTYTSFYYYVNCHNMDFTVLLRKYKHYDLSYTSALKFSMYLLHNIISNWIIKQFKLTLFFNSLNRRKHIETEKSDPVEFHFTEILL
jgi:hypothetical protein